MAVCSGRWRICATKLLRGHANPHRSHAASPARGARCSGGQIEIDRRFERRQNQLVAAQGAEERFLFSAAIRRSAVARDDTGLRTAEQLVAAEADEIDAAPQDFGRCGSCSMRSFRGEARDRSVLTTAPLPRSSTNGTRLRARSAMPVSRLRRLDEAVHEEIAAMHFEDQRRLRVMARA